MRDERSGRAGALLRAAERLPELSRAYLLGYAEGMADQARGLRPMRQDLQLGERIWVWPALETGGQQPRQGVVCYLHPRRRYYTVDLEGLGRESFPWGFAE